MLSVLCVCVCRELEADKEALQLRVTEVAVENERLKSRVEGGRGGRGEGRTLQWMNLGFYREQQGGLHRSGLRTCQSQSYIYACHRGG